MEGDVQEDSLDISALGKSFVLSIPWQLLQCRSGPQTDS